MSASFLRNLFGKKQDNEFLQEYVDCHSHILPGVDDGVKSLEESLAILSRYEDMGVKELWLTPHIMEEVRNTPEKLHKVFDTLRSEYKGDIKLSLAAENMMDSMLQKNLEEKTLLPIGTQHDKLLVETSYFDRPHKFIETLEIIMSLGYTPLLAHPERYNYMGQKDYDTLKDLGILFQLNLFSLTGFYGTRAQEKAWSLVEQRKYNHTGSDLHSRRQLEWFNKIRLRKKDKDYLMEITHNPV